MCRIRKENDEFNDRAKRIYIKMCIENWNHVNRFTERILIRIFSNNIAEFCRNDKHI
jgi:hypothetical protein